MKVRDYKVKESLKNELDKYARELVKIKTLKGLKKTFNKHLQGIFTLIKNEDIKEKKYGYYEYEKGSFANINTIHNTVTVYNSLVKLHTEGLSKYSNTRRWIETEGIIKVPKEIESLRENRIISELKNRIRCPNTVDSLARLYDFSLECLNSVVWYKKAIGIAFFTGRRISEICKEGKLTVTRTPNVLNFRGQLKKKGQSLSYKIPCLHAKDVVMAQKELRELKPFDNIHIDRVAGRLTSANTLLKKHFGKDMSVHKLRSIYALYMSYYNNVGERWIHESTYRSDILGHTYDSNERGSSTHRYEVININYDLPHDIAEKLRNIDYFYKVIK